MKRLRVLYPPAIVVELSPATTKATALAAFPKTRGECEDGERPCPYQSCRYHLWDTFDFPRVDTATAPSCALDVADNGEHSPATIAKWFGMTRQAVENIEKRAIAKVKLRRG